MPNTNLVSQAEFSRLKGYSRSYATELKHKGLLVKRGKFVDIHATEAKISEFSDPAKQAVADRHAEGREANDEAEAKSKKLEDLQGKAGNVYQTSRALNEKYKALSAQIDYEQKIGKLLTAEDVGNAIASASVVIRTRLENLPDSLAPRLASESDEAKIRSLMMTHIEEMLTELSRQFSKSINHN